MKNISFFIKKLDMVNIFIPFPNIYMSVKCLDRERLGKQRVECKQIIDLLEEYDRTHILPEKGWSSHPAFLSWIGFTNHLKVYFDICVKEWTDRGYVNNMQTYNIDQSKYNIVECSFDGKTATYNNSKFNEFSFPYWVSFPPFYKSHQAALLRKNPKYYIEYFGNELGEFINNGYLWPCRININCINDWNFSYHDTLATGCPPVFRIPLLTIIKWSFNPNVNPTTGRKISNTSAIYKDYLDAFNTFGITYQNYQGECYFSDRLFCLTYMKLSDVINYLGVTPITPKDILFKLL